MLTYIYLVKGPSINDDQMQILLNDIKIIMKKSFGDIKEAIGTLDDKLVDKLVKIENQLKEISGNFFFFLDIYIIFWLHNLKLLNPEVQKN